MGVATLAIVVTVAAPAQGLGDSGGVTNEEDVVVWVGEGLGSSDSAPGDANESPRNEEFMYAYLCADSTFRHDQITQCPDGNLPRVMYCEDGSEATPPMWVRYETPAGSDNWGPWSIYRDYYCGAETSFAYHLRLAWAQMPIAPHTITLQPDTGWVYANVPTIAMVDREQRQIATTILGRSVLIRANPGAMTWTWGDGDTTITTDRGNPYPHQTLTHTYAYFEGDVTVTLTSTWSGQYSLDNGATWNPAPGTATTTSTPVPLTVYNPHTHIVNCDLNGTCYN